MCQVSARGTWHMHVAGVRPNGDGSYTGTIYQTESSLLVCSVSKNVLTIQSLRQHSGGVACASVLCFLRLRPARGQAVAQKFR